MKRIRKKVAAARLDLPRQCAAFTARFLHTTSIPTFQVTIFMSFDDSTMSKSNPKQSFWWQQHEIATGKKFEARRKNLPVALSQSQVGAGIVAFHLARLFDAWVDKAIIDTFAGNESSLSTTTVTAASAAATADIPEDDANSESTNFVGWAMKETLDMYRDVWRSSDD
mmetsp:Transcript_29947/g.87449  ORF Transcript_29947/g.87449 Transcript_29947/m.87449 type:complete len:168 (+) Transcript_29947:604-1107(+)